MKNTRFEEGTMANQIRRTTTEPRLRAALTELLAERGLETISVSDITRRAGVNRGTFYAHYTDKHDLVQQLINGVLEDLTNIVLGEEGVAADAEGEDREEPADEPGAVEPIPFERVQAALVYARDHYALLAALTDNGTDQRIYEQMKALIGELVERSARQHGITVDYGDVPEDYAREMMLSGVASVIWLWLRRGCPESPRGIATIIWKAKSRSLEECAQRHVSN